MDTKEPVPLDEWHFPKRPRWDPVCPGEFRDVRVFNRLLTDDEMTAFFEEGPPRATSPGLERE